MSDEVLSQVSDSLFLHGRIIDVIPVSVYQDKIFEQDLIFEQENGVKIVLSDVHMLCKSESIGQIKKILIINSLRSSIETCEGNKNGIFPYKVDQGPEADIFGSLEKIIEPSEEKYKSFRRYAILNFGTGYLWVILHKDHKEDFTHFHEGDCVSVKAARLDLLNVS